MPTTYTAHSLAAYSGSYFYNLPSVEGEVFVVGDVAELVAEAVGGADGFVDVAVGVAVDPVVNSAVGDEVC